MDAVTIIKNDHKEMRKHMDAFKKAHEDDDASTGHIEIKTMCELLTVHSLLEENHFYPEAQSHDELSDEVQEGFEEHALVDQLVEELGEMNADDPELMAKGKVMVELVEHHMKEEEDELLPKAEKAISKDKLEEMGKLFEKIKAEVSANA